MRTNNILIVALLFVLTTCMNVDKATAASKKGSDNSGLVGNEITEPIELTLDGASGMEIILDHSFGNIDIRTGQNNRISIRGEKKLSVKDSRITEEFLKEMRLEITELPNRVKIVTEYPDTKNFKIFGLEIREKVRNFSISYTIEVPPNVTLTVENSFGDINITGVSGTITVSNGYGKITARTLNGDTSLKNKFGSIQVNNITGDAYISTSHSSLDIGQIDGNLKAETTFGSLTVIGVKGSAELSDEHGKVVCSDISGDTGITTSFGSVECKIIGGTTTVTNSHGAVRVEKIDHDVRITTSFAKVTASTIKGNLTVVNEHGPVEAAFVDGGAEIRTTFGSVQIGQIVGDVSVKNQHGSITAQNILTDAMGPKRNVRLKTSHASIKMAVPETLSATIDASTSFGKLTCDFPLVMNLGNADWSSSNSQRIKGTVGGGKDSVELEATHSNIYIEKM